MKFYGTCLRVFTQKKGKSGLGLKTQRFAVQAFSHGSPILAEFVEVESDKKNARPQLAAAIAPAKAKGVMLLIAKLDRLSRNVGLVFQLRDTGVDFVCFDMLDANTLTVGTFAVLAQHERKLISQRTKAALAAQKAQGAQLGTPANLTPNTTQKGRTSNQHNARTNKQNERAAAHIRLLEVKASMTPKLLKNSMSYAS